MAAEQVTSTRTSSISKVLHIVHGYYPESGGGTEAYVRSLLEAQPRLGLECFLLHGSFEPRARACLEERDDLGLRAFRLHRADAYSDYWDKAHYPPAGEVFEALLDDLQPDIVHVHQWIRLSDDLVVRALRRGVRALVSLHDLYASCPACFRLRPDDSHCERSVSFENCADCVPLRGFESPEEVRRGIEVYRDNARRELLAAGRVLAATEATRQLVCAGLGLDHSIVQIEPLGYAPRFGATRKARVDARLHLAYWGNVTARKGVDVLLDALRLVASRRAIDNELELTIFGKVDLESLREDLQRRAEGLPVRFAGRYEYDEIVAAGVDLAVFPSTCFETYGFVLDEAFELGVPALVTKVGAFEERLGDAGFLVPPGDAAALAATLEAILDDRSLLMKACAAIPARAPTPEDHARRLLAHYEAASTAIVAEPFTIDRSELEELRRHGDRNTAPRLRGLAPRRE